MNNVKLFLLVKAILFTSPALSQEITLKGEVRADSLSGFEIHILNITQTRGTTTSITGEFEIEVMVNDTLIFSAIQFEQVKLIITPEIIDEKFLVIKMEERINELEEVQISNVSLTGNLQHDISEIEKYSKEDFGLSYSTTKPLTSIERKLHTAQSGEIDALLNLISGRTKMLKTAKENEETLGMVERAITIFSTSFFVNNLQIPENKIKAFLYFCTEDSHFRELMSNSRRLELLEYFQRSAPGFLKNYQGYEKEQKSDFQNCQPIRPKTMKIKRKLCYNQLSDQ